LEIRQQCEQESSGLAEAGLTVSVVGCSTESCNNHVWSEIEVAIVLAVLKLRSGRYGCTEVHGWGNSRMWTERIIRFEKDRCSSKIKPRLRAEWVVSIEELWSLAIYCLSPHMPLRGPFLPPRRRQCLYNA